MSATASIRDLRNRFPKIRKIVEAHGEVLLTEKGKPRYRLTAYSPPGVAEPPPKDYMERLKRHQPRPSEGSEPVPLAEDNRGDR